MGLNKEKNRRIVIKNTEKLRKYSNIKKKLNFTYLWENLFSLKSNRP